ncbi:hypothetical protein Tco_1124550 [Tanacetum coccineum]|uniref:Uncharacterized protein n=1 Tax=Tanacetum coccineum TaxID=301880 RepID=A0ABQ5J851_9ASTR
MIEDAEDEGPTADDRILLTGDKVPCWRGDVPLMGDDIVKFRMMKSWFLDDEVHSVESVRLGIGGEGGAVPEGQQLAVPNYGDTPERYDWRSYLLLCLRVTFGALWRLVLALESWAGQTDAQRAALWHAITDMQGESRELQLQLVEERCARLELAEIVDSMMRRQEPKGDA